jgi:hypothetical protein
MKSPTNELTEYELVVMETLCKAASPGPWCSYVVGRDLEAGLNCIELGSCELLEVIGGNAADQDFIANARMDVPRLIGEVRRLRALVAQMDGAEACQGDPLSSGLFTHRSRQEQKRP